MPYSPRRPPTTDSYQSTADFGPHRLFSPDDFKRSRSPIPLPPRARNRHVLDPPESNQSIAPFTDDARPQRPAKSSQASNLTVQSTLSGSTFGPALASDLRTWPLKRSSHIESREELISLQDDSTTDGESDLDYSSSVEASLCALTPTASRSESVSSDSLKEEAAQEWAQYEERRRLGSILPAGDEFAIPNRVTSLVLAALPKDDSLRRSISLTWSLQAKGAEDLFVRVAPSSNDHYPSITTGRMSPASAHLSIDSCKPLIKVRGRPSTSDGLEPRLATRTIQERRDQVRRSKKITQVLGEDPLRPSTSSSYPRSRPKSALSFSSSDSSSHLQKRGSLDVLASGTILSPKAAAILGISHPQLNRRTPAADDEVSLASVEVAPKFQMGISFMSIDSSDDESDGSSSTFLDPDSDSEEESTLDDAVRRNKKLTQFFGHAPPQSGRLTKVLVSLEEEVCLGDETVKKSKTYRLRKKGSRLFA